MIFRLSLSLLAAICCFAIPARAADPQPAEAGQVIVALGFEAGAGVDVSAAKQAEDLVNSRLRDKGGLAIVGRSEVAMLLTPKILPAAGAVDSMLAANIVDSSGIGVVLSGRIFRVEDKLVMLGKLLSGNSTRVFGEMVTKDGPDALSAGAQELADKLIRTLQTQKMAFQPTLLVKNLVVADLRRLFPDKTSMHVAVSFEKTPQAAVAENQMREMLLELGLEIVDPERQPPARFTLTGDVSSTPLASAGAPQLTVQVLTISLIDNSLNSVVAMEKRAHILPPSPGGKNDEAAGQKNDLQQQVLKAAKAILPRIAEWSRIQSGQRTPPLGMISIVNDVKK